MKLFVRFPFKLAISIVIVSLAGQAYDSYCLGFLPVKISIGEMFTIQGGEEVFAIDRIYEHVDGEEELFRSFGTKKLFHAIYANDKGGSFSIELYVLSRRKDATGLYRHFAGAKQDSLDRRRGEIRYRSFGDVLYAVENEHFLRVFFYGESKDIDRADLLEELFTNTNK